METSRGSDVPESGAMTLRFWGVRGSMPTPSNRMMRYGGNTLAVELRCGPHLLILDAGSGLHGLGRALATSGILVDVDLLLTHTHLDHVCGLPFFAPMFDPRSQIRIWAGHLLSPARIAAVLRLTWRAPLMPDIDKAFRARLEFHDFAPGADLPLRPGLRVGTAALHHPGNAVGYRVEWNGVSLCYVTDTEHPPEGIDENLRRFVAGADMMIYDANHTDAEYQSRIGWGHSTWQAGARLADAAGVRRLVLFHHDPDHDDETMDEIVRAASARRPGTVAAREGMSMIISAHGIRLPNQGFAQD